ncbi:MAG: hypothetical protein HXX08_20000 [Chloroflexi bacterium]|uniref:Uncharacterized protein n=1 Tax=Candidatus Chlorohelix allophototropha TaxID=3003348 RepID=A0A8T7M7Y7_9CHLR|nr:hypothetical protein [Chloroflexota bacterium]WJW68084.1 hypothetical protein OZ401_003683 [Chloroflexota bacterium L227-S17]
MEQSSSKVHGLDQTRHIGSRPQIEHTNLSLLVYWVLCTVVGFALLWNDISSWRVATAWQNYGWLALVALVTTILSQIPYMMVSSGNGRPIAPVSSTIFVIVNGAIEAFVFLGCYNLLFNLSKLVFGDLNIVNFIFGLFGFIFYSGFIHAFFWARLIPPHFSANPKLQPLRRMMPFVQITIVVGWCIYYYFTADIWTVVALHALVDGVLMFWVRPPVLFAQRKTAAVK